MSTPTDSPDRPAGPPPQEPPPYNSWQQAYAAEPEPEPPARRPTMSRPSPATMRLAALVAAAAAAGAAVTYIATNDSNSPSQVASTALPGQQGGTDGQQQGPGAFPQGPGGVDGEQRIVGTLAAVGDSSIALTTPSGTETYAVTDATQIAQDGVPASLSDLTTGETVLVHLVPSSSGSSDLVVERIIAGNDLGRFGPDDNGSGGSGADDATSTALDT